MTNFAAIDFETAVRLSVSLGGYSDTIACITGGIAEAFYGHIPEEIFKAIWPCLPDDFQEILQEMERVWRYPLADL
jgi:ADP-ribosylglycohydrolase